MSLDRLMRDQEQTAMSQSRFLMCPPTYFGVEYVINPWMEGQIHSTDSQLANHQWSRLHDLLAAHSDVFSMPPVAGLPDLVFTANAALIYDRKAVLSSFRFPERRPEAQRFADWLIADGFHVSTLPPDVYFEGAGDALLDRLEPLIWLGHGMRSSIAAKDHLELATSLEVQPLRLENPSFYHLDTCFCPLEGGYLLYYPQAFDEQSQRAIASRVPASRRIALSQSDALHFACNAINIDHTIILNAASDELQERLTACGFETKTTSLTEFIRAGGAAKCLSLRLDEANYSPVRGVSCLNTSFTLQQS